MLLRGSAFAARCRRTGWLLLFLAPGPAAVAQLTPTGGPDVQVASTATFQSAPALAVDAAGTALVAVWQRQSAAGDWDIFGRRYQFDAAGHLAALGSEFPVNTLTVGCQQFPAVAADAAGNFVVAWQSDQDPGGASGIYARRFNSSGTALDPVELRVNTTVAGNQERPAVAMSPDGRYLVTWQSDSQAGGQGWDVVAQAFSAGGAAAGAELRVNATTAGAQHSPRVAYLAASPDSFAVVWESASGIFLRRVSPAGATLDGTDVQVNTTAGGFARHPTLASDLSGNYVVAWENADSGGSTSRILARRFQGTTALNNMADLTLDGSPGATQQHDPAVATDALGNWVVAWDSVGEDGSGAGIVAESFDNRQNLVGAKVLLDSTTAGDQTLPALAMTAGGSLLAAWQSVTPAVDGAVVLARPAALTPGRLFTIAPCRLIDTRNPNGPLGGPVLTSGTRIFPVLAMNVCGIPSTAKVLSLNLTAVSAMGNGFIALFPGDALFPGVSSVNFTPAHATISNNAQVTLSRDGTGTLAVTTSVSGGSPSQVHLVVDVNGYYP
jgi:hypothetical protein